MQGVIAPRHALPAENPCDMPRQGVHGIRLTARPGGRFLSGAATGLARLLLALATLGLTGYGAFEMHGVLSAGDITVLQWLFLAVFTINFAWIGFAACQAVLGFFRQIWVDAIRLWRGKNDQPPLRTAILSPVYNEDPQPVAAALAAMAQGLAEQAPGQFAVFILSDSNKPDAWIAEEATFRQLIATSSTSCPIYYRHRHQNTERKAGNIADWVMRWGGGWEAMLVLDADSLIAPDTIIEMARRMAADPGLGLLQSLPAIAGARSLYARLQQFSNRCYGPIFGNGLAAWHGRNGNFWGHNAIIRTAAFAEAARLPELTGPPPFGGHVLSHDFIEAAFLRRAGWGVRIDTDLVESYEQAPPSLIDVLVRDRRWCQGNLQHVRFLLARGLTWPTRLHLLTGIMAYLSAVLWLLLVAIGMLIAVQAAVTRPEYFKTPALFPTWPVFDSERAVALFLISMGVVLAPKALGWLAIMIRPRRLLRFGGPLALTLSVLVELLLSVLYAPIMMIAQSGFVRAVMFGADSGWATQRRGDGRIGFGAAIHAHRWHMAIGVALAFLSYELKPALFLWLLPVSSGLILAAPLSWMSDSVALGQLLKRLAILRTPEEQRRTRPAILTAYDQQLERFPRQSGPALSLLSDDPQLRAWHLAQLGTPPHGPAAFDPQIVLARAKAERAHDPKSLGAWLTTAETMALLNEPELVTRYL
jgi:membrane glycosyltransferase